jgi:hypothetical protein
MRQVGYKYGMTQGLGCTRQSIVEREGLGHDERSEECSKGMSSTTCFVK